MGGVIVRVSVPISGSVGSFPCQRFPVLLFSRINSTISTGMESITAQDNQNKVHKYPGIQTPVGNTAIPGHSDTVCFISGGTLFGLAMSETVKGGLLSRISTGESALIPIAVAVILVTILTDYIFQNQDALLTRYQE